MRQVEARDGLEGHHHVPLTSRPYHRRLFVTSSERGREKVIAVQRAAVQRW